jgi:hypothetical protein
MKLSTTAALLLIPTVAAAFCPPAHYSTRSSSSSPPAALATHSKLNTQASIPHAYTHTRNTPLHAYTNQTPESNYLLDEFRTADGEIIDPYKVLKVPRKAEHKDIRQSYRMLSKKYHPDGVRFREVLPGKCDNLDDVRDEWERVKLSYEILSDKKLRKKYDRHSALSDPASTIGRMAADVMGWGMSSFAKGIMNLGDSVIKNVKEGQKHGEENSVGRGGGSSTRTRSSGGARTGSSTVHAARNYVNFPVADEPMVAQNNAMVLNMKYGHRQVMSDPAAEMAQLTREALERGMTIFARGMFEFGNRAVEIAAKSVSEELERQSNEWKYKR